MRHISLIPGMILKRQQPVKENCEILDITYASACGTGHQQIFVFKGFMVNAEAMPKMFENIDGNYSHV